MAEIVVARKDGVLSAPDGTRYRMVRGKTLADARHPAVEAHPDAFMPIRIELGVDGDATASAPSGPSAGELKADLVKALASRDELKAQLTAIIELIDASGLEPIEPEREGWVQRTIAEALRLATSPAIAGLPRLSEVADEPLVADPETKGGRATVRAWAIGQGYDVSPRGALPRAVVDAYRAAHGG